MKEKIEEERSCQRRRFLGEEDESWPENKNRCYRLEREGAMQREKVTRQNERTTKKRTIYMKGKKVIDK